MSAECQHCTAPAELYLCRECVTELRDMLDGLPRWITHLTEAATGQARLGDGGRNTSPYNLVPYTDPRPADDGLGGTEGQRRLDADITAGKFAMTKVLAAAHINTRAGRELANVTFTLSTWVREVCETRGLDTPTLDGPTEMARWLRMSAWAIACSEAAGKCFAGIEKHVMAIERIINRPEDKFMCGPCPTLVESEHKQVPCNVALWATDPDGRVSCPRCKSEHDVRRLRQSLFLRMRFLPLTRARILDVLANLGETLPSSTLYDWCANGKVRQRGTDPDTGDPTFWLADVRKVMGATRRTPAG